MILLKNFSNENCMAWRGTYDGNADFTLSDLVTSGIINQVKVIIVFLNENPNFLLHILVVYLESFPKHYIKVSLSIFRVMELESYSTAGVIHVRMRAGFLRARVFAYYPHWYTLTRLSSSINPSQLNDSIFLFFHIAFSLNFFTLVGFFKTLFLNDRLQFKWNRWYYFCVWWNSTKLL